MRLSKIVGYENPCNVIGVRKLTGSEEEPKLYIKDKNNGTWKATNMEVLTPLK